MTGEVGELGRPVAIVGTEIEEESAGLAASWEGLSLQTSSVALSWCGGARLPVGPGDNDGHEAPRTTRGLPRGGSRYIGRRTAWFHAAQRLAQLPPGIIPAAVAATPVADFIGVRGIVGVGGYVIQTLANDSSPGLTMPGQSLESR